MSDPLMDMFGGDIKSYPGNKPPKLQSKEVEKTDTIAYLNTLPSAEYSVNGNPTQCYTIGSLCKVLGRKAVTIRSWEAKGWMPKPKLRTRPPEGVQVPGKAPKGRRLYSRSQVEYLIEAVERFHLEDPKVADWNGFRQHLKSYPVI